MRNLNIRQRLILAFLFAAFLTLVLGGISAFTINLLNRNLRNSSEYMQQSVSTELAAMRANNKVSEVASHILAAQTSEAVVSLDPTADLEDLKKQTGKEFDWSISEAVSELYQTKRTYLFSTEALDERMKSFAAEVTAVTDQVGEAVAEITAETMASAESSQSTISSETSKSTSEALGALDTTVKGTLNDVVLVLQLRGLLLELEVEIDNYVEAPSKAQADTIKEHFSKITEMLGNIPDHVAGMFEVMAMEELSNKARAILTDKGGILSTTTPSKEALATLNGTLAELHGKLVELADNTVFDGTTSLENYLEQVSGTIEGSLTNLISTQQELNKSLNAVARLQHATTMSKERLYDIIFLVQDVIQTRTPASVEKMNSEGAALVAELENHRAELSATLIELGRTEQATAIDEKLAALAGQIAGEGGVFMQTEEAVAAHTTSIAANRAIETKLTEASQRISESFRDFTARMATSAEEKIAQGGFWMRVQLILAVVILVVATVMGLWMGTMIARRLSEVVLQLFALAQRLTSSAASMAESSDEQAAVASEQAAALEESSSTVEEISSMAARNTESVRQASVISADVQRTALEGTEKMASMAKSMDQLNKASDQIGKIIRAIDEIAFQTNILALNAAVEAARAGEAGAGFAVVADEVRNLALKCKNAAQETEQIIAQNTVLMREGVAVSSSVGDSLEAIKDKINHLDSLIKGIADASQEQSIGLEQINRGLQETSATTQKNAALAEQGASSATDLTSESHNLMETVDGLSRLAGVNIGQEEKNSKPACKGQLRIDDDGDDEHFLPSEPRKTLHFAQSGSSERNRLLDN